MLSTWSGFFTQQGSVADELVKGLQRPRAVTVVVVLFEGRLNPQKRGTWLPCSYSRSILVLLFLVEAGVLPCRELTCQ